ncbi:MAG TPA: hypothetical protein GXZ58_02510 [Bacilli bacterium]|nr:hypothetical protein [Bacilli bacterium]
MKRVKKHINHLFQDLPNSQRVEAVKENMLDTVEDKYQDLLAQNYDENEVANKIISELGSVDEIKKAIGMNDLKKEYDIFKQTYTRKVTLYLLGMFILPILSFILFMFLLGPIKDDIIIPLSALGSLIIFIYFLIKFIQVDSKDEKYRKMLLTKSEENLQLIRYIITAATIFMMFVLVGLEAPAGIVLSMIPLFIGIYYYIKLRKNRNF